MGIKAVQVKELRRITGMGMNKCMKALRQEGTIENAILYFRRIGDEPNNPNINGLSKGRVELFKNNQIVRTFKDMDELESEIPNFMFKYSVRLVNCVGHYYYLK